MNIHPRSLANIATLDAKARQPFADFALAAQELARSLGCEYIIICGNRTYAEQEALFAQGRTKPGDRVTNARGGFSNHNFGIAVDFGVFKDGKYLDESNPKLAMAVHKECAALAEDYGLTAGLYWESFPDAPHYEIATNLPLAQKRARFERSGSVL